MNSTQLVRKHNQSLPLNRGSKSKVIEPYYKKVQKQSLASKFVKLSDETVQLVNELKQEQSRLAETKSTDTTSMITYEQYKQNGPLKIQLFSEFVSTMTINSNQVKEILEKFSQQTYFYRQDTSALKSNILTKIENNEQFLIQSKLTEKNNCFNIDEVKLIASNIYNYVNKRAVENFFYASLIDYLYIHKNSYRIEKVKISQVLDYIIKILPNWIKKTKNPKRTIIQINAIKLDKILEAIDNNA